MSNKLLFLSYAGIDADAAHRIAKSIEKSAEAKKAGLKVWLDKRDLKPNVPWQEQVSEVIEKESTAFAVYIGGSAAINWSGKEVDMALSRAKSSQSYKFIPILTSSSENSRYLPPFARQYTSVKDVQENPEELKKLIKLATSTKKESSENHIEFPFVGLRSFDESNANLFFGREKEIQTLVDIAKKNHMLMVVGHIGSGKSSLVRAGVTPAFRGGMFGDLSGDKPDKSIWSVIGSRPGEDPFERLANNVNSAAMEKGLDTQAREEIISWVRSGEPDKVYDAIVKAVPDGAKILLVVDHFEELFIDTEESVRRNYIDCLVGMNNEVRRTRIYVVMTIQHEYYNLCSRYQTFYNFLEDASRKAKFTVDTMGREGLLACIEKPLEIGGVSGCDDFVKRVLSDVMERPSDVAILQVALAESWRRRHEFDGDLLKSYESINGVSGALAKAADEVYEKHSETEKKLIKQIFLRLVHLSETGKAAKRTASKNEFSADAWKLVEKFTSEEYGHLILIKKHITASKNDSQTEEETAEISHEALTTHWPKYQSWLWEEAEHKHVHDHLILKSKCWQRSGCQKSFLARGNDLKEYIELLKSDRLSLSELECSFIKASRMLSILSKSALAVGIALFVGVSGFFAALQISLHEDKEVLGKYFMHSAKEGDIASLQTFIKIGINVNTRDSDGNTALMYAIKEKHMDLVEVLVTSEATEINAKNNLGETALMFAANSGEKLVNTLLEYGADINAKNNLGETALFYSKDKKVAELLLKKGINGRFKKYGQNIVFDAKNEIDWFCGADKDRSWDDARDWVERLNKSKFSGGGWRMPKISELKSLYKSGTGKRNMIPLLETSAWWVWSGEAGSSLSYEAFDFSLGKTFFRRRTFMRSLRGFAVRPHKKE